MRNPDERELRSELAFEALLGVQLHARVALLAEVAASAFDQSLVCLSTCAAERSGFTSLVAGNLGARVALAKVALGARLVLPLTDDPSPFPGGLGGAARDSVSPALSVEALARFWSVLEPATGRCPAVGQRDLRRRHPSRRYGWGCH